MSIIILDHIDGIFLDNSKPPIPNLHALNYLPSGLFSLAATVKSKRGKGFSVMEILKLLKYLVTYLLLYPAHFTGSVHP